MVFANGHKRMNVQRIVQQLRQISDATGKSKTLHKFNNKPNEFNKPNKFNKSIKSIKKMVRFNIDTDNDVSKQTNNYRVPTPYPFKLTK
jgi:hypothetical protein